MLPRTSSGRLLIESLKPVSTTLREAINLKKTNCSRETKTRCESKIEMLIDFESRDEEYNSTQSLFNQ